MDDQPSMELDFEEECEWFWELILAEADETEAKESEVKESEDEDSETVAQEMRQRGPGPWWYTYEPARARSYTQQHCREAISAVIGELLGPNVVELIHVMVFYSEEAIHRENVKYRDLIEFIYSREDIINSLQRKVLRLWRVIEGEQQLIQASGEWDNDGLLTDSLNAHEIYLKKVQIQLIQTQRELVEAHGTRPALQRWLSTQAAEFQAIDFK